MADVGISGGWWNLTLQDVGTAAAASLSALLEMVLGDVIADFAAERLALLGGEPEVDAGFHAGVGVLVGGLGEGGERADGVRRHAVDESIANGTRSVLKDRLRTSAAPAPSVLWVEG